MSKPPCYASDRVAVLSPSLSGAGTNYASAMSALPPKADMCGATAHLHPPKADVGALQINICLRAKSGHCSAQSIRCARRTPHWNHIASRRINKKRSENASTSHPGGRSRQGAGSTQSQCALSIDVNWSIRGSRSREAISDPSLAVCKGT